MKNKLLLITGIVSQTMLVQAQVNVDDYLSGTSTFTTIGTINDQVNLPRDLDFNPLNGDLWVLNRGLAPANGSSTVTFSNVGKSNQTAKYVHDSHANHFMRYSTGIAFGDNGNFTTSNQTNNGGNDFAGPALWTPNPSIYGVVHQTDAMLGSHIDMLHQSSFAMGVAWNPYATSGNGYWLYDGENGNICKYDFHTPHAPGYDDHSDGEIWRYSEMSVTTYTSTAGVPNHMIVDKVSGMLYIVDNGSKRVLKLDSKSGSVVGNLAQGSEPLAGYYQVGNASWSVYINTGLTEPCGIDYKNNRLLISDHANGNIYIYNTSGASPVLMKTIATGATEIMGIKIGPDGKIYYVDNAQNTVVRVDPPLSTTGIVNAYSLNDDLIVYPNPTSGTVFIEANSIQDSETTITLLNVLGDRVLELKPEKRTDNRYTINIADQPSGIYFLQVSDGVERVVKKISLVK